MKFVVPFALVIFCASGAVHCTSTSSKSKINTLVKKTDATSAITVDDSKGPPAPKNPPSRRKVIATRVLNSFKNISEGKATSFAESDNITNPNFNKVIQDIIEIYVRAMQPKESSSKLSDNYMQSTKVNKDLSEYLRTVVEMYELFIKALRNFTGGLNYTGPVLYGEVMAFTRNNIDENSLICLINCLRASEIFYHKISLAYDFKACGKILAQIESNISICGHRRELILKFCDFEDKMKVNSFPYWNCCDCDDNDLTEFIKNVANNYPKPAEFFDAFVTFAKKNMEYYDRNNIYAQNYLKSALKMKEKYDLLFYRNQFRLGGEATKEKLPKRAKRKVRENSKFTIEDFKKEESIGKGGQAFIYKGTLISSEKPVAIKVYPSEKLNPGVERVFNREVFFLDHMKNKPFICKLLYWKKLTEEESKKWSGDYILVMELAKANLSSMVLSPIWDFGKFTNYQKNQLAKKWMAQMVVAVQHMHALGIIHCDLKLANILLTDSDDIRVCDFGLTKRFKDFHDKENNMGGTHGYIPPENFNGTHASYKTDIFALGMIFYYFIMENSNEIYNLVELAKIAHLKKNFATLSKLSEKYMELPVRKDVPKGAKELFVGMVNPKYKERFTIVQIMQSEYFREVDWRSLRALEALPSD